MKKKAMALTVAAMMAAAMITGCGQTAATTVETAADTTVQTEESTADTESTAADTAAADGESYTMPQQPMLPIRLVFPSSQSTALWTTAEPVFWKA